jgi:hypothetical protein
VVIGRWKTEFVERSLEIFKKGPSEAEKELQEKNERVAQLERKVGVYGKIELEHFGS